MAATVIHPGVPEGPQRRKHCSPFAVFVPRVPSLAEQSSPFHLCLSPDSPDQMPCLFFLLGLHLSHLYPSLLGIPHLDKKKKSPAKKQSSVHTSSHAEMGTKVSRKSDGPQPASWDSHGERF